MQNLSRRKILSGGVMMTMAGATIPLTRGGEINQVKLKALVKCLRRDDQVICACYADRQLIADFIESNVMGVAHTPKMFMPTLPRAPEKLRMV